MKFTKKQIKQIFAAVDAMKAVGLPKNAVILVPEKLIKEAKKCFFQPGEQGEN